MDTDFQTQWDLARYFYTGLDDPRLRADIDSIVPRFREFVSRFSGRIRNADADTLAEYYDASGALHDQLQSVELYLFYRSSLDTQDTEVAKLMGEVEALNIEAEKL